MTAARRRSAVSGAPEIVDVGPVRGRTVCVLAGVLFGLALSVVALVDQLDATTSVELPRLEVPRVDGTGMDAARSRLERLGFVVEVLFQPNENAEFPKGTVFAQRPLAGAKVQQGDIVGVLVSDGPLGQQVPDTEGQQVFDATRFLQSNGLVAEVVPTHDEIIRAGQVLSTVPKPGGRVAAGGTVKVLMSDGPAPRVVPAVLDLAVENALAEIGRAGLAPGTIKKVFRPDLTPGVVFEVDPAPGTELVRDSAISLSVAAAEPRVKVPFVVGLLQATAGAVLSDVDLQIAVITTPVAADDPVAGRVVSQGTPPQAEVRAGTVVQVTVAVATAPAVPPPPVVPGP